MSHQFSSEEFSDLRDNARLLVERAGDHEDHLDLFVSSVETEVRLAESALAQTPALSSDQFREFLRGQLARRGETIEAARQLRVGARQQQVAARRVLTELDGDSQTSDAHSEHRAVLVVDDYQTIREIVAQWLHNAGFVVRTATDGLEALIAAHELRPRVIVMDVSMPVLDGIAATRLIKAGKATRHAQVIAHTSHASLDNDLVEELFAAVLHKPASPHTLIAAVEHASAL